MGYPKREGEKRLRIDVRVSSFTHPELYDALERQLDGLSEGLRARRLRELLTRAVMDGDAGVRRETPAPTRRQPVERKSPIVTAREERRTVRSDPAGGAGGVPKGVDGDEPTVAEQVDALQDFDIQYSFGS